MPRITSQAAIAVLLGLAAAAQAQTPATPVMPEVSDVATLPPAGPHRLWIEDAFSGAAQVIDGDTGALKATIPGASLSSYAAGPDQRMVYVAESIWTLGNRGQRQDMVSVYDGLTLKLQTEIPIPSRAYVASDGQVFALNHEGTRAYVYSMQPASGVVVIDLALHKVLRTVDTPGCALAFPWGSDGFSALCGDGSLATVTTGEKPSVTRSAAFFDAERDPVFEQSPTNGATGRTFFVTYSGAVHPVDLGPTPRFEPSWSLQAAAGLQPAGVENGELAWRPGGYAPMALHRASGRLFVLMHAGEHWTQKKSGEELWMVDTAAHKVLRRLPLKDPCIGVAVSQDDHAQVYLMDEKGNLSIRDAQTLDELRSVEDVGRGIPVSPAL
ncbi:MAG TPA: amine dehydrogenase large subunit [Caulobacteraceae bacterium]|jgi:methylamine dehydrogenase heavy chain|nr:amine dehydrogenase large subunit [Caulobacteraceae bacterium]